MPSRTLLRIVVGLTIAAIVAGLYMSPLRSQMTRENISAWVEQLRAPWYGPIVFIVTYAIACVFALPASLFIMAAGLIWGWLLGGTYALIGGITGATLSFLLGRFLGEGLLARFGRAGRFVMRQVDHAGFRSLLLIRFVPGLPFAVVNYGAGVAGVRFTDFLFATSLGVIPPNFVFAYFADALFNGTMTQGDAFRKLAIFCLVLISFILLSSFMRKRAVADAGTPVE